MASVSYGRMDPSFDTVPASDPAAEPDGFVVTVDAGDRLHVLDWGGPAERTGSYHGVLLIHGLSQTAWSWAPVARRLCRLTQVIAMDLRGHGLSDAPTGDADYDTSVLGGDVVAVAEGSGLCDPAGTGAVVLAGHGFGAIVAAVGALGLGDRCAGLVLVDGGWESMESATGVDVDEFMRGLDEPPEVMRSMASFLADRRGFDPETWDDDQQRAAEATVVETHAGHVVQATRPHALEASVRTMFGYEPIATLARVPAPVVALMAGEDDDGGRRAALRDVSAAREREGRDPVLLTSFGRDGHNLMRYRPREVTAAILTLAAVRG